MIAKDGKKRKITAANTEGIFRIIQDTFDNLTIHSTALKVSRVTKFSHGTETFPHTTQPCRRYCQVAREVVYEDCGIMGVCHRVISHSD